VWLGVESWRPGEGVKEKRSVKMICVTVEVCEGALKQRVQISATSIERALKIAGDGAPGRRVRLLFPIDSEAFFVPGDHARREVA
jgi:hypothetical protein